MKLKIQWNRYKNTFTQYNIEGWVRMILQLHLVLDAITPDHTDIVIRKDLIKNNLVHQVLLETSMGPESCSCFPFAQAASGLTPTHEYRSQGCSSNAQPTPAYSISIPSTIYSLGHFTVFIAFVNLQFL
jgi:hypothetical protein